MSGQCMRQGCARAASVSLVFDAVGREVWLDAVADGGAESAGGSQAQLLCPGHAEALSVPVGWAVVDRRPPLTPQTVGGAATEEPVVDPTPALVERAEPDADAAGATDEPAAEEQDDDAAVPDVAPVPDVASAPAAPRGGERRGGSMLDRAFAWAGPQRSVITERGGPVDPDEAAVVDTE